jgi:SAM-dependent methyltransferase
LPLPAHGTDAIRVVIGTISGRAAWEIQLSQPGPTAAVGREWTLHFRARADGRRRIGVGFARAIEPWTDLGLYGQVSLSPEWESYREQFTLSADFEPTRIVFDLGDDQQPVEIANVSIKTADGTLVQGPTQPVPASPGASLSADGPAGTLNRPVRAGHVKALKGISSKVLTSEVLARIQEGEFSATEESVLLGCEIQDALRAVLDTSRNRASRRRYRDQVQMYEALPEPRPPMAGATILDLGCGALNPYGTSFTFLMLGARRGLAVDLDEILDVPRAVRALADLAAMMLIDPKAIIGDFPVTRAELLQHIGSFDLPSLARGDPDGIDRNRLVYLRESVEALPLADGEADYVFSNAMLEHLPDPDTAIAEMARVTRPGGVGVHIVDGSDHRTYADPTHHPLEFLTEKSGRPIVHGSNRVRPAEFLPVFERHGLDVLSFRPFRRIEIPDQLRKRLAEPWRGMDTEVLAVLDGQICVRRRP